MWHFLSFWSIFSQFFVYIIFIYCYLYLCFMFFVLEFWRFFWLFLLNFCQNIFDFFDLIKVHFSSTNFFIRGFPMFGIFLKMLVIFFGTKILTSWKFLGFSCPNLLVGPPKWIFFFGHFWSPTEIKYKDFSSCYLDFFWNFGGQKCRFFKTFFTSSGFLRI